MLVGIPLFLLAVYLGHINLWLPNPSSVKCYQWSLRIKRVNYISNTGLAHGSHSERTRTSACRNSGLGSRSGREVGDWFLPGPPARPAVQQGASGN